MSHILSQNQKHNVGMGERWVSTLSGSALMVYGVRKPSMLGGLLTIAGAAMLHRGVSGYCGLYGALGINTADHAAGRRGSVTPQGRVGMLSRMTYIQDAITLKKPVNEVYRWWRDLSNLQIILPHVHCVSEQEGNRSQWVSDVLGRREVKWEAVITEEIPGELIAWKTIDGSDVHHGGRVEFSRTADGRGTEVRVQMRFRPPLGALGAAAARMINRSPAAELSAGLHKLRDMLESGELVTTAEESPRRGGKKESVIAGPQRSKREADAAATEASEESFPASDPPSFSPGTI